MFNGNVPSNRVQKAAVGVNEALGLCKGLRVDKKRDMKYNTVIVICMRIV